MGSHIGQLKDHGLSTLGIGLIRLYQNTLSKITPSRCRYYPSCSQYGITAIQRFGLYDGMRLTYRRIKRCKRPNGGYDPVPITINFSSSVNPKVTTPAKTDYNFKEVKKRVESLPPTYEHKFRLILTYPTDKEFLSKEEFEKKIAEFYENVLEIDQYTILYQIDRVEAGTLNNHYLLRFSGTTSEAYLENKVDEVVGILVSQLEGFFLCVQPGEFQTLYFEVDGQVYIQPKPEEPTLPRDYDNSRNLWLYTNDISIWDHYWGSYLVEDLFNALLAVADVISDINFSDVSSNVDVSSNLDASSVTPDPIGDTGCDLNPFDGDGCSFGDLGNGCDGLDLGGCGDPGNGCDGCDAGGGLGDLGNGCDGLDLGGCDGCSS